MPCNTWNSSWFNPLCCNGDRHAIKWLLLLFKNYRYMTNHRDWIDWIFWNWWSLKLVLIKYKTNKWIMVIMIRFTKITLVLSSQATVNPHFMFMNNIKYENKSTTIGIENNITNLYVKKQDKTPPKIESFTYKMKKRLHWQEFDWKSWVWQRSLMDQRKLHALRSSSFRACNVTKEMNERDLQQKRWTNEKTREKDFSRAFTRSQ